MSYQPNNEVSNWTPQFYPPRNYQAPIKLQNPGYIPQLQSQRSSSTYLKYPIIQQTNIQPNISQQYQLSQSFIYDNQTIPQQNIIQQQTIQGEKRIEFIPYEKSIIEFEEIKQRVSIPRQRIITDYQAIEYQKEYIPKVFYDKITDYKQINIIQDRIEYFPIEKQIIHSPPQQQQTIIKPPYAQQPTIHSVQQPMLNNIDGSFVDSIVRPRQNSVYLPQQQMRRSISSFQIKQQI